jgi:3-oxoacyl-[acyl-carrier protein] reductase
VLLEGKNAVIYGAGGAIGGAVARTFAREGARVFLAGTTRASLDAVAHDITAAGGVGEVSEVDALDEHAVERHAQHIVQQAGRIDISFNLVGVPLEQGTPLIDLSVDDCTVPVAAYLLTHLITARAAARRMLGTGSGVILTMTRGVQELYRHAAASSYSWIRPPSRSHRLTCSECGVAIAVMGERILESGALRSSAR